MQCVILAAGRGTRMGSLTDACPKPMLEVAGKPKLAHTIELLPAVITEVILVVGYLDEQIRVFFGDEYAGRKIRYVVQNKLNGTDGAVRLVKPIIKGKFIVLMGDDLYRADDIVRLLPHDLAMLAIQTDEAARFGLVSVSADGSLVQVIERPHDHKTGLINIGAYMLSPAYWDEQPVAISDTEYGLPQTLAQIAHGGTRVAVEIATDWQPIGNPEDLKLAQTRINDFL